MDAHTLNLELVANLVKVVDTPMTDAVPAGTLRELGTPGTR